MGDPNLGEGHRLPPESPLQPIEERDSSLDSNPSTDALPRLQEAQDHQGQSQSQPGPSHQQTSETRPPNPRRPNLHLGHLSSHQEQPQTPLSARAAVTRQPTESGSVYYGGHSQQDPSLTNRTASQQQVTQWPSHSLAGPNVMDPAQQGNVYVDPEYRQLNPRYGSNNDKPVWGLAKPLPRVVRPGMRRDDSSIQKAYEAEPPGQTQAAPELSATPGLSSPQPRPTQSHRLPSYSSTAQQGIAKQHAVYAPQPDGVLRPMESEPSERTPSQKATIEQQGGEQPPAEEFLNTWVKVRHILKEPLAEWLATTVAVLIGLTGTLAVSTGGTQAGSRISENWSWGLGFMIGIYLAGGISGAHLNPGISIALWIFRGFPGRRCCYYVVAQILGAITAAGVAYCLYRDAIFHLAPHASAGAAGLGFYTEPLSYVSSATAFFTEFVADAILLCVIFAMGDDSNAPPGAGMHSFVIGLVIYVLCICLGFNTGGCLNPVRDFGPRLVALMAGYGGRTFTDHDGWWFWGCWVATIGGSLTGACLYDLFIFIGGESPVNYAPRRRQRAKLKEESKWRKRLGVGKQRAPSLEEGIKNLED
ncbi:Glycerol uptake facilitator protein [Penicillium hispanicum]|uniref:Glycerol uptake facilitator protein n=1 Tax=Penicillium hispanicum TaxID=1080232 RepID=UPI00254108F3|nr:Glycerol uptake facilitator protein [Penicillium hispanicum]KAJ5574127.1 Glycerol uptake facilitator protein [Penicillium hispanicum]